jgi:hypothetical protein
VTAAVTAAMRGGGALHRGALDEESAKAGRPAPTARARPDRRQTARPSFRPTAIPLRIAG